MATNSIMLIRLPSFPFPLQDGGGAKHSLRLTGCIHPPDSKGKPPTEYGITNKIIALELLFVYFFFLEFPHNARLTAVKPGERITK